MTIFDMNDIENFASLYIWLEESGQRRKGMDNKIYGYDLRKER